MPIEIKTEYRNIEEIAARVGKRPKATTKLIKKGIIPAVKIGREYWMSEEAFQQSLVKRACQ